MKQLPETHNHRLQGSVVRGLAGGIANVSCASSSRSRDVQDLVESYNAALESNFSDAVESNKLELALIRVLVGFAKDEYELKVRNARQ